jgi:hypothetical protein
LAANPTTVSDPVSQGRERDKGEQNNIRLWADEESILEPARLRMAATHPLTLGWQTWTFVAITLVLVLAATLLFVIG